MNCNFKILWFEDEASWYTLESYKIKGILGKHNLKDEIVRKTGLDFNENDIICNDYDLILMDYKLASEDTGDKIISRIRSHDVLTDILFYSSQYDEMVEAVMEITPPIDGVYYANRKFELFEAKLSSLINKIVKRSEDIINLRGFVLDNSCDFEVRIKEVINILWSKMSETEKAETEKLLSANLEHKKSRNEKCVNKIYQEEFPFIGANNDKYFLSHSDRLFFIENMMQIVQIERNSNDFERFNKFKMKYEENISTYRNALGHRKDGENTIHVKGNVIPVDDALHRLLRQNIQSYSLLISDLEDIILEKI